MDWGKEDVVFLIVIMFCLGSLFMYSLGLALIQYPIIVGIASLITILVGVIVWSLNRYFNIRELEAQPNAVEKLNQKYAEGKLTEEELEEKTEKVLN